MCKVYNTIGALSAIQSRLVRNGLDDFDSLDELLEFQRNFESSLAEVSDRHRQRLWDEKTRLEKELEDFRNSVDRRKTDIESCLKNKVDSLHSKIANLPDPGSKLFPVLTDFWKNFSIWSAIWSTQLHSSLLLIRLERASKKQLIPENERWLFLSENFDLALRQSSFLEREALVRKKRIIDEIENLIYGAKGEHQVEKKLKSLPNDFILINDFNCEFSPAIRDREGSFIKSVQMDHILVCRSGVFLIETKNWSENTIANRDMRSPVQQVQRANFALFKILADVSLKNHHWGQRKVPIRNLLVLINHRPMEQFNYVKILTLSELLSYIQYFPPTFSSYETQQIADYLLRFDRTSAVRSRLKM